MNDEEFLSAFESCALTAAQWHHREHIRIAYLYLLRFSAEEAFIRTRAGLHALNTAQKVPDIPTRGYHETLTRAWLRLVQVTLDEYGPAESSDAFLEKHPHLAQRTTVRLFYSADLITSARAKAEFVEPDLAPLPKVPERRPPARPSTGPHRAGPEVGVPTA